MCTDDTNIKFQCSDPKNSSYVINMVKWSKISNKSKHDKQEPKNS